MIVSSDQLRWVHGADHLRRYDLACASSFATSFCSSCGANLPRLTRDGRYAVIPAGSVEGDIPFHPEFHEFHAFKADWVTLGYVDLPIYEYENNHNTERRENQCEPPIMMRPAVSEDAASLTSIAMHSKAYWGYSSEFMRSAEAELSVKSRDILDPDVYYWVAIGEDIPLGFYALSKSSGSDIELDAMFVTPEAIGRGIGKKMMAHAKKAAVKLGAVRLIIQSDPSAAAFYQKAGGVITGKRESESISGRFLPILEIALEPGTDYV